jgi:5-methylcytosine-specific restriction enzyme subunit McrC
MCQRLVVDRYQPSWRPTRLNIRYQPAVVLAELILAGDSFEQRVGNLYVSGFVFDMWKIYEDFVCVALREAMKPYGGRVSLQRHLHLDEGSRVDMRSDFYWASGDGHRMVVDAKYKGEKPAGFPNADLYQLLAYCTVLGLDEGHLIYAQGNEDPISHTVAGSGVRIQCHTLNLESSPAALLERVKSLVRQLAQPSRPVRRRSIT